MNQELSIWTRDALDASTNADIATTNAPSYTRQLKCSAGYAAAKVHKKSSGWGYAAAQPSKSLDADWVELKYQNCAVAPGMVLHGFIKFTATTDTEGSVAGDHVANFVAGGIGGIGAISISVIIDGVITQYGGGQIFLESKKQGQSVSHSARLDNFSIYGANYNDGTFYTFGALPSPTFVFTRTLESTNASFKVDGLVSETKYSKEYGLPSSNLYLATPTTLTGTVSEKGVFSPVAGELHVKLSTDNTGLATTLTVAGPKTTIGGNPFRSGPTDWKLETTWAELMRAH